MHSMCPQRRLSDDLADMERRLLKKAYKQGFDFGQRGLKISQMDWDEEFLPEYNRGYKDGLKERT